jgi:hypothetical protein
MPSFFMSAISQMAVKQPTWWFVIGSAFSNFACIFSAGRIPAGALEAVLPESGIPHSHVAQQKVVSSSFHST